MTALETYLQTGQGDYFADRTSLRQGLLKEVLVRAAGVSKPALPELDLVELTRRKIEPMICGLFPKVEQPILMEALSGSVIVVSHATIESIILNHTWDYSAWTLANLYLHSLGLPMLSEEAVAVLGMSEELRCYITSKYFVAQDPLADFLVHEVAHVFHNYKRERLGLPFTRSREWLLPVKFACREPFALSCEAYSRIRELKTNADRLNAIEGIEEDSVFYEVVDILRAAVAKRNGWKEILRHCS
jgi:hypothetical protein